MPISPDMNPRLERGFLLFAAAAGFLLVLLCTSRYGIGLFPDTANYFAAAESLRAGEGLRGYDGAPYTAWPPLYPALIAFFGLAGVSPETSARTLNALAFGALVYLAGRFLFAGMRTRLFARAGVLSVLLSMPLLDAAVMAYTDLLFALACLGAALALERFSGSGARRDLIGAALLAASAGLLRYMGVAVILTGLAVALFSRGGDSLSKRLRDALFFGLLSALPLALWVTRNLLVSSNAAGGREASALSLGQNLLFTANTLTAWLMPSALPVSLRCATGSVLGLALAFMLPRLWRAEGKKASPKKFSPSFLFALIYPAVLLAASTAFFSDSISDRLLAPMYVFLMGGLFTALEAAYLLLRNRASGGLLLSALLAGCVVLWLGYPLSRVVKNSALFLRQGSGGFSVAVWRESPLAASLRESPPRGDIYSNVGNAVYLLSGRTAHKAPGRGIAGDFIDLRESVSKGHETYLVWFRVNSEIVEYRAAFYTPPETLAAQFRLERTAVFPDGDIYRVRPGKGMVAAGAER